MSANPKPWPDPAQVYDDVLTWQVPSRTKKGVKYRVELGNFKGNGQCCCPDFNGRFAHLLEHGYTPQRAWDEKLVELRPYQRSMADLLRCAHICEAREQLADHMIRVFVRAAEAQGAKRTGG